MLFHEIIDLHQDSFTKSETKIANYLMSNLEDVHSYHLVSLSNRAGVSKSAMLRFCQKLGYSGFAQFKYDISRQLITGTYSSQDDSVNSDTFLSYYLDSIQKIPTDISEVSVKEVHSLITNARRIKIFGIHESGLSAKYLSYRLSKIGYDSEPILNSNEFFEKANFSDEDDLHLFVTLAANSIEILESHDISIEKGTKTILITSNSLSRIAKDASAVIEVPSFNVDRNNVFLDSQPIVMIVMDYLVSRIALFDKQ